MKKKILSLMLAMVMMLSLSVTALAETTSIAADGTGEVTLEKSYTVTGVSPEETFCLIQVGTVSISENADHADDTTPNLDPASNVPDSDNLSLADNETVVAYTTISSSEDTTDTGTFTIGLPKYEYVGEYVYLLKEVTGTTAGVTYDENNYYLVVQVTNKPDGSGLEVSSTLIHKTTPNSQDKVESISNKYEAGQLTISKSVTGAFGEKDRLFEITVTFKSTETVNSTITYGTDSIVPSAWTDENGDGTYEVNVPIKLDNSTEVVFENIPYGVTYSVEETDDTISDDGYDDPKYSLNNGADTTAAVSDEKLDNATETVKITNNKDGAADTGISLDSLPYILMLIVVAAGVVVMISRRRLNDKF